MTEQEKKTPNPGSDEAIEQGCICAVLDNRHGLGAFDALAGVFWITSDCPLHGLFPKIRANDKEMTEQELRDKMDRILVKMLGQTIEVKGEISLVVKDLPANCMVLFVDMETWEELKDKVEIDERTK